MLRRVALTALLVAAPLAAQRPTTAADVQRILGALAHDSMEGRFTATAGERRAAAYIAATMRGLGLTPAGDSGYHQRVALAVVPVANPRPGGRTERNMRVASSEARDTFPAERRRTGYNVLGVLPGSDASVKDEIILVDAHFDHVGIGRPVDGDSIYNGADDDASGVVTVLEIARQLLAGKAPRRTVVFAAMTGEEQGLLGTGWYIEHPPFPLERHVGNLEVEMIGRPDSLAGGFGKGWLTGYERSTMGAALAAAGIPLVADPRPDQRFFERSDNIAFARRGIVAHTLSSFNLHTDYHRPSDDASKVDAEHMAAVINAATKAVRVLADGPTPAWVPGGKP